MVRATSHAVKQEKPVVHQPGDRQSDRHTSQPVHGGVNMIESSRRQRRRLVQPETGVDGRDRSTGDPSVVSKLHRAGVMRPSQAPEITGMQIGEGAR